jgi:ABC-type multidrug transport system fused ATPase/permease subunit
VVTTQEPGRTHALPGGAARRGALLLWRGMRSQPLTYVAAVLTSAAFGAFTVAVSQVLGWATDHVVVPTITDEGTASATPVVAGLALLAVAVGLALGVAGRRIFAGMGYADIGADHRRGVTRQYLRLPLSWHREHPTGQLLANASSDVEAATGVFNPLPFALGVVVMIGVATVSLVRTDGWLAATALAVLPLAVLANLVFQRRMTPVATRAQQLRAEVADVAHESFEAALLVTSLGTADREEARFAASADRLRAANVRVGQVRAVFDPVIELLPSAGTLAVLLVGTWRLGAGAVQTGDVVGAAYLLTLMAVPVRAFGWVLGELPRALVGHDRIARVLDARGEQAPGTRRLPAASGGAHLVIERADVELRDPSGPHTILRDVSLDVAPGRVVAVVGPTGSGKTTLVGLLARLLDPVAGRVLLDGVDLRALDADDLARHVALVAQQTFVFEDTVRGNVTLADPGEPGAPDDDEVWQALRLARVADVVRALPGGLDARLGERGANLSGGQRQRLAIARALVRHPRLLVLDDATSAVDPQVEQAILTGLRGAGGTDADGPTVVLVAYRMASVALADEVVHLDGGRVVDRGTHAELLARDAGYRELATAYERAAAERDEDEEPDAEPVGDEDAGRVEDALADPTDALEGAVE